MFPGASFNDLPSLGCDLIRAAEGVDGAIIVYAPDDRIVWANAQQRQIASCCEHSSSDTYETLFWSLLKAGKVGNKQAFQNPADWLASAISTRRTSPNLDFINTYPWGRMLVSHLMFENGMSIQARINLSNNEIGNYFTAPTAGIGVLWASKIHQQMQGFRAALDSLEIGIGLVDGDGRVIHLNNSLTDMVKQGDGITHAPDGTLMATDIYDDMVFRQALQTASDFSHALSAPIIVPLRRPNKMAPHLLVVSPGNVAGTTLLAVSRFGEDLDAIADALRQAFNLSPAEAQIAARLGAGMTVKEIAESRSITEATAYTQIKSVKIALRRSKFAANGFNDIASLVMKLAAVTRVTRWRN